MKTYIGKVKHVFLRSIWGRYSTVWQDCNVKPQYFYSDIGLFWLVSACLGNKVMTILPEQCNLANTTRICSVSIFPLERHSPRTRRSRWSDTMGTDLMRLLTRPNFPPYIWYFKDLNEIQAGLKICRNHFGNFQKWNFLGYHIQGLLIHMNGCTSSMGWICWCTWLIPTNTI